jgi:hypothetical protein
MCVATKEPQELGEVCMTREWRRTAFRIEAPRSRRVMSPTDPERPYVFARDRVHFIKRQHTSWARMTSHRVRTCSCWFPHVRWPSWWTVSAQGGCDIHITETLLSGNWTNLVRSTGIQR